MAAKIFFIAFTLSLLLQGIRIWHVPMVDSNLWAAESQYVEHNDQTQFYISDASAHPGGSIVGGTILTHWVLGTSYHVSLRIFLDFAVSVVAGFVCILCYALKKSHVWWLLTLATLSLNVLYHYASPPSTLVSVLAVLLYLITWYLYENKPRFNPYLLVGWAVAAGIATSSRTDIGTVLTASFGLFLIYTRTIPFTTALYTLAGAVGVYALTDPFLWLQGLRHIQDIISVNTIAYAQPAPYYFLHLTVPTVITFSIVSFISIGIGAAYVFKRGSNSPVPQPLYIMTLCLTSFLYLLFLSAQLQTPRYFLPIVLIWETLLPLYFFSLLPYARFGQGREAGVALERLLKATFIFLYGAYLVLWFIAAVWVY